MERAALPALSLINKIYMKIKVVTHASDPNHKGYLDFKYSMEKFGYDYITLQDKEFSWEHGYLPSYKWCKANSEGYTHILHTDSYDVVALTNMEEVESKLRLVFGTDVGVLSAERGLYPNASLGKDYPPCATPHKYVNGGQFLFPIPLFIEMYEQNPVEKSMNVQEWLTRLYLYNNKGYILDIGCEMYQSVAFEDINSDFAITRNGRLLNRHTGSLPCWAHNNGGSNKVPDFIKNLIYN